MKKYRFSSGFTLIELMIVVAIAAILLMVAAPDMSSSAESNRVEVYQKEWVDDIAFARQEAITRNKPITLCSSADGNSCVSPADWGSGWIVFVDQSNGVAGVVDGADEVLKIHGAVNTGYRLQATENYFQFNSRGWLVLPSANEDIILTACSPNNSVKGVLVMASGRALASRIDANGNDYVKVKAGVPMPLACI